MTTDIVVPADLLSPLVVGNKTFRSFFDIRVSEEDLEKAKSELGETEEKRDTSLRKLKEELKEDKTAHYRMDDAYLLRFLRYRKFDCDRTYKHIKNFYRFRRERPDIFTVPSNFEFLMNKKLFKVIPYRDEEGSAIFWTDYRHLDDLCPLTLCQLATALGDVLTMDPSFQINGVIFIWDLRGISSLIRHSLNPWAIRLLLRCLQDCYPWRVKKLIAVNVNKIVLVFYSTIRHVIKKKNRDKVNMTTDIVIPADRLNTLVEGNNTFRSFYDIRVSKEDLERAKSELGETEELRNTCLLKLKEELKKDKTAHYRMDDAYLLHFLRYRKFDCDRTYKHIKNFYRFRRERPDIFTVPSNFEFLMNKKLFKVIPYRDEEGSAIFWTDYRHLEDLCPLTVCQMITALGDVLTMDPSFQINGVIVIWDMRGISSFIRHSLNPWAINLLLRCLQDCYPWRIKKLIAVNVNKIVLAFYLTIRHVIKKKNRDKIVFLGEDLTELKDHLNPVLLPKEYGGTVEEDCFYTKYIMDNLPYIKYERSFE